MDNFDGTTETDTGVGAESVSQLVSDAAQLFTLLQEHAEGLRGKGVRVVKVGAFEFALDPPEIRLPEQQARRPEGLLGDPLSDPATYARGNGRIPGFPRIREMRGGMFDDGGVGDEG